MRPRCCFAPFHWSDLFGEYRCVNAVTSDAVDPLSFQPEFKVCAVSLTKVTGMYSRTRGTPSAARGPDGPPRPPAPFDDAGRRQVKALWASQTGMAEDFAAAAAERLSAEGLRASLVPMAEADPAALPR